MTRVLLTGATGFIGRSVLPLLVQAGYDVHAISRNESSPSAVGEIVWHELDLLDCSSIARTVAWIQPEQLIHLAWYAEHGRFWVAPENVQWVEASLALLRAFAANGGRRAVMVGTCAEYDWTPIAYAAQGRDHPIDNGVFSESGTSLHPATLYGTSKHATQIVADSYAEQMGLELAWGRVFFLYGPGEPAGRLVSSVAESLLAGRSTPVSDGSQMLDFMYVQDVAAGLLALLRSGVCGAINIASGIPVPVRSVVEQIARLTGGEELLQWGAIPRAQGSPNRIVADITRLRDEVGFTPTIGLDEGLRLSVQWWQEQLDV